MTKLKFLFFPTILALAFGLMLSCAKKSSDDSKTTTGDTTTTDNTIILSSSLANIDVIDAESLFIVPGSSSSRSVSRSSFASSTTNTLFKITETGAVEEVEYKDADNNTYTVTSQPVSIDKVDSNYIVFIFGSDELNPTSCYLTNKSTGAVYDLGSSDNKCPVTQGYMKRKKIFSDNNSNLYYRYRPSSTNYLRQVNYSDPTAITASMYTPDSEGVNHFIVDSSGNAVYTIWESPVKTRIRKSNGGYYNLSSGDSGLTYWIGLDGNIYNFEGNADTVYKTIIDSNYNVTVSTYTTSAPEMVNEYTKILKLQQIIAFATYGSNSYITIDNGTAFNTVNVPLSIISRAKASSNYVYLSGTDNSSSNSVLVKINPSDNSSSQMYTKGTYDIYNFNVTSDDNITFSALRMNDGKKVLGKILANGTLSITDESINKEITILERIR